MKSTKFFSLMGLLLCLVACSGRNKARTDAPKEDDILNAALEDNGVINFFDIRGVEKGLVVRGVKWGKPISSDNPGADCELKRKAAGAPQGTVAFACVVRENGFEAVVLTISQELKEGNSALRRMTLDGKGVKQRDFWIRSAQKLGFSKKPGAKARPDRSFWVSPDRRTELVFVWNEAAQAVTMIFSPAA